MEPSNICTNSFPSIGDLPIEIISQIFDFLDFWDRQAAGATCQSWRDVLCERKFHTNTLVCFRDVHLDDRLPPASDFLQCDRPFQHFELRNVTFGEVQKLMEHIGKHAVEIAFNNCTFDEAEFFTIMGMLPHIRHLSLSDCKEVNPVNVFEQDTVDRHIADGPFSKLKRLTLGENCFLSKSAWSRLLLHLDSIETLDLSGWCFEFYNGAYNSSSDDDLASPGEDPLSFDNLMYVLSLRCSCLRELNFIHASINGSSLAKIQQLVSRGLDLVHLRLARCWELDSVAVKSFLETQPHLIMLDLSCMLDVDDDCVAKIVETSSLLEDLNFGRCLNITNVGAALLGTLKKLRRLDISDCPRISTDGLKGFTAHACNSHLRELNLGDLELSEEGIKCVALNLTELRVLNVGHCKDGVTDDSVQCIVKNLRWLRELSLAGCRRITDAALTGFKVEKSDLEQPGTSLLEVLQPNSTMESEGRDNSSNKTFKHSTEKEKHKGAIDHIDPKNFEGVSIMNLRGLKVLNLDGCSRITDDSLRYGLKFIELKKLSLAFCDQISLVGLEALVRNCPAIEELDLIECHHITNDENSEALITKLSRLRTLNGILPPCASSTTSSSSL